MQDDAATLIIAMERAALDLWGRGDPFGFLEICAPDVVYFDPFLERRLDGLASLTRYYESLKGRIKVARFEILNPKIQLVGTVAVLTFNYISYDAAEGEDWWNCTEVYRQDGRRWQIIQTHWSRTKPGE